MFDYTIAAIGNILKKLRLVLFIISLSSCGISILYYSYASIAGIGKPFINLPLIALILIYAAFLCYFYFSHAKKGKKIIKRAYRYTRLAFSAVSLGFTIYEIYLAANNVRAITVILASLSVIFFIVKLILEIGVLILEPKVKMLSAAVMKDFKDNVAGKINLLKGIKGEEKMDVDLSEYDKEIETLSIEAERRKQERKAQSQKTWDKRLPLRRIFRKKENKVEKQNEVETKPIKKKKGKVHDEVIDIHSEAIDNE